jgi:catechol-2,3-dioxygenase
MASPTNVIRNNDAGDPKVAPVDMKLEVVVIPVSDVERAEQFYRRLGWRQDVTPQAPAFSSSRRTAPRARSNSARL